MRPTFTPLLVCLALLGASPAGAQAEIDGDEIVRLPGQGLVKPDSAAAQRNIDRLVPGGGLFASFDVDDDGLVSALELEAGTAAAFAAADSNGDGQLVALEQLDWAGDLPTRDDTLANPVRFDPNLDRVVTLDEFKTVIDQLAAAYQDRNGAIAISRLSAPEPKPERDEWRPSFGGPDGRAGSR